MSAKFRWTPCSRHACVAERWGGWTLTFDLVLMDVHMPRLDGLSATRALRAAERASGGRHTVVLAMTATSEAEDGQACLDAGMDGFLAKPFGLAQLRAALALRAPGQNASPGGTP